MNAVDSGSPMLRRWKFAGMTLYTRREEEGVGVSLYYKCGAATSVEQMVNHDGPLIYNGGFRHVFYEDDDPDSLIVVSHPWMGTKEWLTGDETVEAEKLCLVSRDEKEDQ